MSVYKIYIVSQVKVVFQETIQICNYKNFQHTGRGGRTWHTFQHTPQEYQILKNSNLLIFSKFSIFRIFHFVFEVKLTLSCKNFHLFGRLLHFVIFSDLWQKYRNSWNFNFWIFDENLKISQKVKIWDKNVYFYHAQHRVLV